MCTLTAIVFHILSSLSDSFGVKMCVFIQKYFSILDILPVVCSETSDSSATVKYLSLYKCY